MLRSPMSYTVNEAKTLCVRRRVENNIKYRPRYRQAIIDLLQRECHLTTTAVIGILAQGRGC